MTSVIPARSDPEIAAVVFGAHLAAAMESAQGRRAGWAMTGLDPLRSVVHLHAIRTDGTRDPYHLLLAGDWYDLHPPQARFVSPPPDDQSRPGWHDAPSGSRWLPLIDIGVTSPNGFAFHPTYTYTSEGGAVRQLICCSMSFDYYISDHAPTPEQAWRQGRHTVVALLTRVQEALQAPAYQGPSGALDT